jgi:competence protein CoiA
LTARSLEETICGNFLGINQMPLTCNDGATKLHSYHFDETTWAELKESNRANKHLEFGCCGARASVRTSTLGTKYFAHAKRVGCDSVSESAEHLMAKMEICLALQDSNWTALPEHRITDADGLVIADIFAARNPGDAKGIAFEIQWSRQTEDRSVERTERYRMNGLRTLWLMRQDEIPVARETPAVRLEKVETEFFVRIPHRFYWICDTKKDRLEDRMWTQRIPLREFIKGVVEGRFRFGFPDRVEVPIDIFGGNSTCRACSKSTYVAQFGTFKLDQVWPGLVTTSYSLQTLGEKNDDVSSFMLQTMKEMQLKRSKSEIHKCWSRQYKKSFLAHKCPACGTLNSANFIHSATNWEDPCASASAFFSRTELEKCLGPANTWTFDADGLAKFPSGTGFGVSVT